MVDLVQGDGDPLLTSVARYTAAAEMACTVGLRHRANPGSTLLVDVHWPTLYCRSVRIVMVLHSIVSQRSNHRGGWIYFVVPEVQLAFWALILPRDTLVII